MGLSAAYYRYMHQIHFNELGAHPAVIMSLPLLTVSTACRHMWHEHADEDGMDGMRSWSDSGLGGACSYFAWAAWPMGSCTIG